jgi:hypothetical protein
MEMENNYIDWLRKDETLLKKQSGLGFPTMARLQGTDGYRFVIQNSLCACVRKAKQFATTNVLEEKR